MIKHYTFTYDITSAEASFKVDTEIFTADTAKATLEFFSWDYDEEGDLIDESLKKYAMEAIKEASFNDYNAYGVKRAFDNKEGFAKIDGSKGIELMTIWGYEFDDSLLDMTVVND